MLIDTIDWFFLFCWFSFGFNIALCWSRWIWTNQKAKQRISFNSFFVFENNISISNCKCDGHN